MPSKQNPRPKKRKPLTAEDRDDIRVSLEREGEPTYSLEEVLRENGLDPEEFIRQARAKKRSE